jgi:5-methylcytosine-specific restriction protein A
VTKRKDYPGSEIRIRAMKRDRFQCTYCGAPGTDVELEIDHIIPVSKGGSHHISNLTTACRACNQKKSDRALPIVANRNGSLGSPRDVLVGMWLHTFKEGRLRYQGTIIAVDGEIALVQLFSWFWGEPTDIEAMPKSFIYSDDCKLYATNEDMLFAYKKIK